AQKPHGGRLPFRPGDADEVDALGKQPVAELDLAPDRDSAPAGLGHERVLAGHAGALHEDVDAVEQRELLVCAVLPVGRDDLDGAPFERARRRLAGQAHADDENAPGQRHSVTRWTSGDASAPTTSSTVPSGSGITSASPIMNQTRGSETSSSSTSSRSADSSSTITSSSSPIRPSSAASNPESAPKTSAQRIAQRIQKRTMIFVPDQAFISKWWCIGAIRKTRLPKRLKLNTWIITDSASIRKMPPIRSSRNSTFSTIAKAASAPPMAIAPVSPMNTSAGQALYQRKPMIAPISAAPRMARSRYFWSRWPGAPDRIHAMTAMAVKVKTAMIPVPAARPSTPSVRFTPLAAPAMMKKSSTYQPQESGTFPFTIGM